ncbi:MAG TPA: hypothetical protein VMN58_00805 [Acidimicrobiales bacterium]|nr:hypothetical protein [Acidimicrobiales bacterium]
MSNIDTVQAGFKEIADRGMGAMLDMPHTDDFAVHVPTLAIDAQGEDEVRTKFIDLVEQVHMRSELIDALAEGPFVTCTLRVESDLRPEPTTAVQVIRFDEEGRAAELWAISPPLPA